MHFEVSVAIDAAPERVWQVLTDVEHWPQWTDTVTSVAFVGQGPLSVGSVVRLEQPKLGKAMWTVSELEPPRSFVWRSKSAGVTTVAAHTVTPAGDGATVTLGIAQTGFLAPLIRKLFGGLTTRYLLTEAEGLKKRCEQTP